MKGYAISAQRKTAGKQTTGKAVGKSKMKPAILKGSVKSTGKTVDNKKMYKSGSGKSY
jgi:hypothetical protein